MNNKKYIESRRAASKDFEANVRAMPEYAVIQAEIEQVNELANMMVQARERAGLTQAEVADRMGIGQSAFSRMERGNVTIKNFMKCLKICGCALKLVPIRQSAACL